MRSNVLAGITKVYRTPTTDYLAKAQKSCNTAQEQIQYILDAIEQINKEIDIANEHKSSKELQIRALLLAIDELGESPKEILKQKAEEALTRSEEFDYPAYRDGLLKACNDDIIFSYRTSGANAIARIDLWRSAGRIEEYARAVKRTRDTLHVNINKSPAEASKYWREKVYLPARGSIGGGGLYPRTLMLRLTDLVNPAPWWTLLDRGTASVHMSSDRDGTPYPVGPRTDFVAKAKQEITEKLQSEYRRQTDILKDKVQKLINSGIKKSQELVNLATAMSEKITQESTFDSKVRAVQSLLKSRVTGYEYDPERIEKLAKRIVRGDEVSVRQYLGRNLRRSIRSTINQFKLLYG